MKKLVLLLCLIPFYAVSQEKTKTDSLDQLFNLYAQHGKMMGSVCLQQDGKELYRRAIGLRDVELNLTSDTDTKYRIGSISKMFTAVLCLQMMSEGKLKPSDKLSRFYPQLPNSGTITMEHLLMHRSGLFNFTGDTAYSGYREYPKTEEELIALFSKQEPGFEPGFMHSYSNTNYVLLSFILEKISGKSFAVLLREKICKPAGLRNTDVGNKINTKLNETHSYIMESGKWIRQGETHPSIPLGAGNMVSTAKDLCVFIEALFSNKLIDANALTRMKELRDGYGYGMLRFPFGPKWFYGHTGGIDGFQGMLAYNPDDKTSISLLGNGYDMNMNDIAIAILSIHYGKPYTYPVFTKKEQKNILITSEEGSFSNAKMGMTIVVKRENGQLTAQASGQSAFPLKKTADLEYSFAEAGIVISFNREAGGHIPSFRLKQGGMDLLFERDF